MEPLLLLYFNLLCLNFLCLSAPFLEFMHKSTSLRLRKFMLPSEVILWELLRGPHGPLVINETAYIIHRKIIFQRSHHLG